MPIGASVGPIGADRIGPTGSERVICMSEFVDLVGFNAIQLWVLTAVIGAARVALVGLRGRRG